MTIGPPLRFPDKKPAKDDAIAIANALDDAVVALRVRLGA